MLFSTVSNQSKKFWLRTTSIFYDFWFFGPYFYKASFSSSVCIFLFLSRFSVFFSFFFSFFLSFFLLFPFLSFWFISLFFLFCSSSLFCLQNLVPAYKRRLQDCGHCRSLLGILDRYCEIQHPILRNFLPKRWTLLFWTVFREWK